MMRDMKKEDDRFVRMRQEDRSWWLRSAYFIEKYKLLWTIGTFILIAMGWQYVSPNERFALLAQNQSRANARIDSVKHEMTDVKQLLRILVVIQCLDRPRKDLALLQLDCSKVEPYRDRAPFSSER